MAEEPLLELDDIQGNVLPGFRKDHQQFLFFRITEPERARVWLKELAPRLSSAREVRDAHALWKRRRARLGREPADVEFLFLNCAISAAGLAALGISGRESFDDEAFDAGLEARAGLIGDPTDLSGLPGAPATWKFGSQDRRPDLLLIVATDNEGWAEQARESLVEEAHAAGMELLHLDRGRVRPGSLAGHEHFGFKDGVSFPAIRGRAADRPEEFVEPRDWPEGDEFDALRDRFAVPGRPLVWPGHFLFGYPRQFRDRPEEPRPNSEPPGPSWARNGSFLVYRRLTQDVAAFHAFLAEATEWLRSRNFDAGLTPGRLGALLVGRYASGWPVMRDSPHDRGATQAGENYFTFSNGTTTALPGDPHPLNPADLAGEICPFAAHIRKVNPRDDTTDLGPSERTLQRLLLRRGITFGPEMDEPDAERGLLFVAYQTSIVDQFEFVMNDWVNEVNKPRDKGGIDPIIGVRNAEVRLANASGEHTLPVPGGWVTATGGEYFFSPGIRFFAEVL